MPSKNKENVSGMFNRIAPTYDFLNHFLSLGIDKRWRKRLIREMAKQQPKTILDVATGTADLAISATKLNPEHITGVDISENMLHYGKKKVEKKGLSEKIDLQLGDSLDLQFSTHSFDAVMVAFGVRNYENLERGLKEMNRVLNTEGIVYILEFSNPKHFPFKQIYTLYFNYLLPGLGRIVSRDAKAYKYLPDTVGSFPDGGSFIEILKNSGFSDCKAISLTFGIATIYIGRK